MSGSLEVGTRILLIMVSSIQEYNFWLIIKLDEEDMAIDMSRHRFSIPVVWKRLGTDYGPWAIWKQSLLGYCWGFGAVERLHGMLFINCEGCLLCHRFLDFLMTLLWVSWWSLIAKGNFKVQKAAPEGQYEKVSTYAMSKKCHIEVKFKCILIGFLHIVLAKQWT